MTKIQRASIYLFYCLQELAWSLNSVIFLNKNLASLPAETLVLNLFCLSCYYYPALSLFKTIGQTVVCPNLSYGLPCLEEPS